MSWRRELFLAGLSLPFRAARFAVDVVEDSVGFATTSFRSYRRARQPRIEFVYIEEIGGSRRKRAETANHDWVSAYLDAWDEV